MIRLVVALTVVGCSSHPPAERKPAPPVGSNAAVTPPARDCKTEATDLGAFLEASAKYDGPILTTPPFVRLVKRTDLEVGKVDIAPLIAASATETHFQGMPTPRHDISTRLHAMKPYRKSTAVVFAFDENTPWSVVVELVTYAESAGYTAPAFAFATDLALTPPPRSAVDDKLDAIAKQETGSAKGARLGAVAREVIEPCPAMMRAFAAGGGANTLIRAIPPALIECDCKLDMASLRSVMWRVLAVEPTVQVIAFDDTTRDRTLALPGATRWAVAGKQIAPRTKGLKLVTK